MRVQYHRTFEKQFKKLRLKEKDKAIERMKLFVLDPVHPTLNNHPLKGKYKGLRSINITGDLRAVYELVENDLAYFTTINTHSNLYK